MVALDRTRSLFARAYLLVPGVYAWLATVLSPTLGREAPSSARVSAFAALVALVAGPYLAVVHPRLGRAVGVFLFVTLCSVTWLFLGSELEVERLDPLQAALGALGWAAFAFGWGSLRQLGTVPEEHPNVLGGTSLRPREALPIGALPVLALSIAGAAGCLALAWRVARPDHSLLAHAAAVACAIAILSAGAKVAIGRGGTQEVQPASRRVGAASRSLGALLVCVFAGLFWTVLR